MSNLVFSKDVQWLSRRQRSWIRSSSRRDSALAAMYGVSVATIRKVRETGERDHAARIAAAVRRES